MPDQPGSIDQLRDHIDELESLIDSGRENPPPGRSIPVLDELVEPGETAAAPLPPASAAAMEERLLRRLDAELADFMSVVHDVVRRCVREELKTGGASAPPSPPKPGSN